MGIGAHFGLGTSRANLVDNLQLLAVYKKRLCLPGFQFTFSDFVHICVGKSGSIETVGVVGMLSTQRPDRLSWWPYNFPDGLFGVIKLGHTPSNRGETMPRGGACGSLRHPRDPDTESISWPDMRLRGSATNCAVGLYISAWFKLTSAFIKICKNNLIISRDWTVGQSSIFFMEM